MSIQVVQRVVVRQRRTRSSSRGIASPSTRRRRPSTRASPPPRSSMPARDHLGSQAAPALDVEPEQRRIRRPRRACRCCGAAGIRSCGRSASRRASTPLRSRFGTSIPVADRMQALQRQVVGVVARLRPRRAPSRSSAARRLSRTFCCCSSSICCGISSHAKRRSRVHRHQPQADAASRAKAGAARRSRNCRRALEIRLDGVVREVARREDVRQRRAAERADAPALREMHLEKVRCRPPSLAERMQRLDHARALRPAAADAGGERDDRDFACAQRFESAARGSCPGKPLGGVEIDVSGAHVLDDGARRQAVLRQADAPVPQIGRICSCCAASKPFAASSAVEALRARRASPCSSAAACDRRASAPCRAARASCGRRRRTGRARRGAAAAASRRS